MPRTVIWRVAVLAALALLPVRNALADSLDCDSNLDGNGVVEIEELSYEAIFVDAKAKNPELELRIAVRNAGRVQRSGVLRLAVPTHSQLIDLEMNLAGTWYRAAPTKPTTRDKTTRIAAQAPLETPSCSAKIADENPYGQDLEILEIRLDQLPPGKVVQVAAHLQLTPDLRAGRWHVTLPARQTHAPYLQRERRVLVVDKARKKIPYWLDNDYAADGAPQTIASNSVGTISWPAQLGRASSLQATIQRTQQTESKNFATYRLDLRLGEGNKLRPDFITFAIDLSQSTSPKLAARAGQAIASIAGTQSEALAVRLIHFARDASEPLPQATTARALGKALSNSAIFNNAVRSSGSNFASALTVALQHARDAKARRPAIIVFTDAYLGWTPELAALAKNRNLPDIVFVADDAALSTNSATKSAAVLPTVDVAAQLGARFAVVSLDSIVAQPEKLRELLSSPPVMHDLKITGVSDLDNAQIPDALLGGQVASVEFMASKKNWPHVNVSGKVGRVRRRTTAKRVKQAAHAAILEVAPFSGGEKSNPDSIYPAWWTSAMARQSEVSFARATKFGKQSTGRLDGEIFLYYLRTNVLPRAKVCYNDALLRFGNQSGRVELKFVMGRGEVSDARIGETSLLYKDAALLDCIHEAAWQLRIPAAQLDVDTYEVIYPIRLQPPADGRPPVIEHRRDELLEHLLRDK